MAKKPPTKAQLRALAGLIRLSEDLGRAPSMQALGDALGMTPRGAWLHVVALDRAGYLRRREGEFKAEAYGVEILKRPDGKPYQRASLLGNIPAGPPAWTEPLLEGSSLPWYHLPPEAERWVRVVLERDWPNHHALRGDVVAIDPERDAKPTEWEIDGHPVVALLRFSGRTR